MMAKNWFGRFGPGILVTAAFVGPGTVTTASIAGSRYGLSLLWTLVFAVVAAIVLQEMAARLGLVTRRGLGEALRQEFKTPWARNAVAILVVGAIGFGNAAFEMGNISGAAIALESVSDVSRSVWSGVVGVIACGCLWFGSYRRLEHVLVAMVVVMGIVFIAAAIMVRPQPDWLWGEVSAAAVPHGAWLTVVGLIGTTVVPYNLFLHADAVHRKWPESTPVKRLLRFARIDTVVAIGLGGLVTGAIMVTAAALHRQGTTVDSAADMAGQLKPLLGRYASWFFAVGLFAAGVTSAITAPLAAAYATSGMLGWKNDASQGRFRAVWFAVTAIGTVLAIANREPLQGILFAQVANGLLLPVVAVFLLVSVNRARLLGEHRNGAVANVLGAGVILVAIALGAFGLWKVVLR